MAKGSVNDNNGTFLGVAGGFFWNRKADESDPDYAEQEYTKADKSTAVRKGARYADLMGMVVDVQFRTHDEYGESINVTIEDEGDRDIISISVENRNATDLMRALLLADLSKPLFIKPYDFIDKSKKRKAGLSCRQDGKKIDLREVEFPSELNKEVAWFGTASKKEMKRYFEDIAEHLAKRVKNEICSQFKKEESDTPPASTKAQKPTKTEAPKEKEATQITPLKMKKEIQAYIKENYPDKEMPKLNKEQVLEWYDLVRQMEELPFPEESEESDLGDAEVSSGDLESQLDNLL